MQKMEDTQKNNTTVNKNFEKNINLITANFKYEKDKFIFGPPKCESLDIFAKLHHQQCFPYLLAEYSLSSVLRYKSCIIPLHEIALQTLKPLSNLVFANEETVRCFISSVVQQNIYIILSTYGVVLLASIVAQFSHSPNLKMFNSYNPHLDWTM